MVDNRVILIVRDGWGYTKEKKGNAVYLASTPNNDHYMETYPWTLLKCTGNAVGLPEGTQGGSEPGHLTMGAGRIVWQPLEMINRSIRDESFYQKKSFLEAVNHCRENGSSLHLAGLLSDQGIHGTTYHLYELLELARREGLDKVFIHCFLDGRDVPVRSAGEFILETQKVTKKKGIGKISSLVGRYYAMDRDTNWNRTEKAYDLLTAGKGVKETDPIAAIRNAYKREDVSDYYIKPIVMVDRHGVPVVTLEDGDAFISWNYRSDRTRQITYALTQREFEKFKRTRFPNLHFVCMSVYDQNLDLPVAFPQQKVDNNLGKILSGAGLRQLRIAETEKYAQVTFFFNSQIEEPTSGEDRILVPSPKVPSYEEQPEMSAYELTEKLLCNIKANLYDFILVNFANGDLVGHSANLEAGIKACEVIDDCVGLVVEEALMKDYIVLLTGDHGNIETMFYPDNSPNPSHGVNPVPYILISNNPKLRKVKLKKGLGLSSIAPTILDLMGVVKPPEIDGPSILE